MPVLESEDRVRAAAALLKEHDAALRRVAAAQAGANEIMNKLKTVVGISGNGMDVRADVIQMIGQAYVSGVMDH